MGIEYSFAWFFVNTFTRGMGLFVLWLAFAFALSVDFPEITTEIQIFSVLGIIAILLFVGVQLSFFDFYKAIKGV